MKRIKYRLSLDMFEVASQTTIKAKRGDSACEIHITLTKNGKIYKISEGCHATFSAKKSDGNYIYDNCTIEGDTIVYDFTSSIDENGGCQVSACEGTVECEVALFKGVEQLTSPRFTLVIDGTVYNGEEIVSSPEAGVLKELINEAEATVQDIETKLANGEFKGDKGDKGDPGEVTLNYAHNTFANALKGNASGTAILLDDVSPITHKLSVKLSSNAIGDEYITYAEGYTTSGVDFEFEQLPDTILKTSPINSSEQYNEFILIHADGNYTSLISVGELVGYEGDVYYTKIVLGDKPYVYYYSDSNYTTLIGSWFYNYSTSSPIVGIRFNASQTVYYTAQTKYIPLTSVKVIVKNNNGETVAEYTPNADGTVDGVKSLYPTTVITTDTDGVTIDCEYNKDLNKLRVAHWEKLLDITIDEEVNRIILTSDKMPQCKEFIVRAIFPVSTTGGNVSLGGAHCYLNNNIIAFSFPATDINKSVITEQRCHILIADDLIYSIGNDAARGQASIVSSANTIIGNRVITDNVTQIIYKLNDSTKSYQIGTQFQVYGKVEK